MRIGHGYDAHRLVNNRPLTLCGVTIPHPQGLQGHSDADAPTHALIDALLGAAALGDIGQMFPDTDPATENVSSLTLLQAAAARVREAGYEIGNVDITIIAQAPKLAPHIPAMRQALAAALNADPSRVSVKATTEEHMGFTGRAEGISAHAVCVIAPPSVIAPPAVIAPPLCHCEERSDEAIHTHPNLTSYPRRPTMTLYNTLTARKEPFAPIEPNKVKMYLCGPTVYNLTHIGNARPAVAFDALHRYLRHKGFAVTFVSNFTDVDDKIINRANEEGVPTTEITARYIAEYLKDANGLNILNTNDGGSTIKNPRATDEIPGMVAMIETLIAKNKAYEVNGTVYFDAASVPDYGKLSHKNIKDLVSGARVDADGQKRSPQDFVLWKPAKPGEPSWPSPWGEGRPGWHIECSVMAKKYLGDTIDIHAGGEDLIFPHHENEIAQSEAANGAPFCNCWLHNGMINIDNQKMSKSKGNFFTTRELAEKHGYETLRFFILSAHYRMPLNFSDELLESAKRALERIRRCVSYLNGIKNGDGEDDTEAGRFVQLFEAAMEDDLNTANALTAVFNLVKYANTHAAPGTAGSLLAALEGMANVLGIDVSKPPNLIVFTDEITELNEERKRARAAKDWSKADEIRKRIEAEGYAVKDLPNGETELRHL